MAAAEASRRYAKALFELAHEEGRVDAIRSELRSLGSALDASPDLSRVLREPLYPAAERRGVLEGIVGKLQVSPVLRSFYSFLIDQRRLVDLDMIEGEFIRLADRAAGLVVAKVRAANPLSADQQERLQRALSARTGQTVTLDVDIDPSLLGGVVAQVGDTVYDGTLKTQLEQLRSGLAK